MNRDELLTKIIKGEIFEQIPIDKKLRVNNPIESISYKDKLRMNKKKVRDIKLRELSVYLEETIWNLNKVIKLYKELTDKTEYWERKSVVNFNFPHWNKIRKARQRLTIYFNEIASIRNELKKEVET